MKGMQKKVKRMSPLLITQSAVTGLHPTSSPGPSFRRGEGPGDEVGLHQFLHMVDF